MAREILRKIHINSNHLTSPIDIFETQYIISRCYSEAYNVNALLVVVNGSSISIQVHRSL